MKNRRCFDDYLKIPVVILILSVASVVVCLLSPVNVYMNEGLNYSDQSVFVYVARIIDRGGIPYRDVFDHKGPVLYFLNYIGLKLNYEYGVWWIEIATVFLSLCGVYKLSRTFLSKAGSLIIALLDLSQIVYVFSYGNLTELYALPLQIFSLNFFVEYLSCGSTKYWKIGTCGLFFAVTLLLQPNLIAVWAVFLVCILIYLVRARKFKFLASCILSFSIGVIIMLIPVLLYFGVNNAFKDFIYDYILFNTDYSSNNVTFMSRVSCMLFFVMNPNNIIAVVLLVLFCFVRSGRIGRKLNLIALAYFVVNLILISISGNCYQHYGMAMIPATIIPFVEAFDLVASESVSEKKWIKTLTMIIALSLTVIQFSLMIAAFFMNLESNRTRIKTYDELNKYIELYSDPGDPIICYGNHVLVYNYSHRFAASKYVYLPYEPFESLFIDEYIGELESNIPPVFIQIRKPNEKVAMFLKEHSYKDVAVIDGFVVYVCEKNRTNK